jgi:transposase
MNEIERLKKRIEELEEALEKEKREKDRIDSEKKRIEREFEEFKAKHAVTSDNLRRALKIKPSINKKSGPLGAPKGHKGYARHIPERIDFVRPLNLSRCPHCETKLGETQEIRHRHVIDIRFVVRPKTTKYNIHRKYCPKCKKLVEKEVPHVLPHARFGLNIMLLVMYLKLGLRLPCNKICDYFMTLYNMPISQGEIIVILRQLATAFGDHYAYLEMLVKLARVKHTDSTSWRINGRNYYAWVFVASGIVLYKIRKRNNHKVGLTLFGKKQHGKVLVVDRHSAHKTLAVKTGFCLQFCWSHILKESKDLNKNFGADGKYVHRNLKRIYAIASDLNHEATDEMVQQLKGEITELLNRHYRSLTVWKFVKGLNRDIEGLFRFASDPEIDATNNVSERELRALVIMRKISNGSRSRRGANATAMLLSLVQTLRFRKENVLQGLQDILKNTSGC